MNKTKSKKGKAKKAAGAANGKKDDGLLLPPPDGTFKQDKVDGSGTLRETTEPEIQEATDYWFGKKIEEARAKDASKKAAEKVLALMESAGKSSVVVFNSEEQRKVRVNILLGADKLRVEKNISINE